MFLWLKPLVVVQKAYEFNLWLIQKVGSFPKSYRFSIGDRLVNCVLEILLRLVDAAYSRDKEKLLTEVNAMLNRLRFLLRLAKDLKLLTVEPYGFAARRGDRTHGGRVAQERRAGWGQMKRVGGLWETVVSLKWNGPKSEHPVLRKSGWPLPPAF